MLRWVAGGLGSLVLIAVLGAWWLITHLDHDWVKPRIVGLVKDATGLDIDYRGVDVSLGEGIRIGSARVASPAEFAAHAPEFVTVEGIDIRADLWSLAFGGRRIDKVRIDKIAVSLVADERTTTLDRLFPPADEPPPAEPEAPPTPLSRALDELPELSLGALELPAIELTAIEVAGGRAVARSSAGPIAITAAARTGASGIEEARLRIAPAAGSRGIALVREQRQGDDWIAQRAVIDLTLAVAVPEPRRLTVELATDLVEQNLYPALQPLTHLVALEADAVFEPDAGKTRLSIRQLSAADGAVTGTLAVELPDAEAGGALRPTIAGSGRIVLPHLPIAIPGVSVGELSVSYDVAGLVIGPAGAESGTANVSAALDRIELARDGQTAELHDLSIEATAAAGSSAATGDRIDVRIGQVAMDAGGQKIEAGGIGLAVAGKGWLDALTTGRAIDAAVDVPIGKLALAVPGLSVAATGSRAHIQLTGIRQDPTAPYAVAGQVAAELSVDGARASVGGQDLAVRQLSVAVSAPLTAAQVEGKLGVASAAIRQRRRRATRIDGAQLSWTATSPLALAPDQPGDASVELTARIDRIATGRRHAVAPSLELSARKRGTGDYEVSLAARARPSRAGRDADPVALTCQLAASIPRSALDLSLALAAGERQAVRAKVTAGVDPAGVLTYSIDASASELGPLVALARRFVPIPRAVRLDRARVDIEASGELAGVVAAPHGQLPALAADPLRTLHGQQKLAIELGGIHYREDLTSVSIPRAAIALSSRHERGGSGHAELGVTIGKMKLAMPGTTVEAEDVSETLEATFSRSGRGDLISVTSTARIGRAAQSVFPEYAIGGMSAVIAARVDAAHDIHIDKIDIHNPRGGTRVTASGLVEQGEIAEASRDRLPGRSALTVTGKLSQDVAALRRWGFAHTARGKIALPFRVESGDLVGYRLRGHIDARDVSYTSRDHSIRVDRLRGVIPIVEEVALLPGGPVLVPGPATNALARMRFFDIHPFLGSDDYVSARSIHVAGHDLTGLAGNVRIDRTLLAVDQLQFGYRGGTVTGQLRADYTDDPKVSLRAKITGVRPTRGRGVLDANAALTFLPRLMSVEGKVQIVRIDRSHLLELLDLIDPYHESVNTNRVRLGLKLGFPRYVRAWLHDGVIDAKVDLGGVAKVVRIDEIKAIPIAPLLELYVAPLLLIAADDREDPP